MKSLFSLVAGFVTIMSLIIAQMGGSPLAFWMQVINTVKNLF